MALEQQYAGDVDEFVKIAIGVIESRPVVQKALQEFEAAQTKFEELDAHPNFDFISFAEFDKLMSEVVRKELELHNVRAKEMTKYVREAVKYMPSNLKRAILQHMHTRLSFNSFVRAREAHVRIQSGPSYYQLVQRLYAINKLLAQPDITDAQADVLDAQAAEATKAFEAETKQFELMFEHQVPRLSAAIIEDYQKYIRARNNLPTTIEIDPGILAAAKPAVKPQQKKTKPKDAKPKDTKPKGTKPTAGGRRKTPVCPMTKKNTAPRKKNTASAIVTTKRRRTKAK